MQVKLINSTQINLVEFDWIPITKLIHESAISELRNRYSFASAELRPNQQNQPGIAFTIGKFNYNNTDYIIKRIEIEDRKIVIEVEDDSKITDEIFADLTKYLKTISGLDKDVSLLVRARDSVIIAKMNFSATRLIDSKLLEFVNNKVVDASHIASGKAHVNLASLNFRIDYDPVDEKLKDHRINLTRKEFLIGPRDGTPLEEQIFISRAPLETDKHLELLANIEKMYS